MNKPLTLFFIGVLSFVFKSNGQNTYPVKKDNVITLQTFTESDSMNFVNFSKYLVQNGYSFEVRDKELYFIQTALKNSLNNRGEPSGVGHQLGVYFKNGNEIVIRLKVELPTMAMTLALTDWYYPGEAKGNFLFWQWYNNVKPLLESYPDKVGIYYSRQ